MVNREIIFVAGVHRSGTSLLYKLIRMHPDVSGFSGTGVPEDEGQHLQCIYPPAKEFGGPGKFVFDDRSYMNEVHPLATPESADEIFRQWSNYWDLRRRLLVEKSPPNIVRTRFLQKLFPNSKFIVILRHPLAVAYATQKWCKAPIELLVEHTLLAYEVFFNDLACLKAVYVIKYEDLVGNTQAKMNELFAFLDIAPMEIEHDVKDNINDKYFAMWKREQGVAKRIFGKLSSRRRREYRANRCGYSIINYKADLPVPLLGEHHHITFRNATSGA